MNQRGSLIVNVMILMTVMGTTLTAAISMITPLLNRKHEQSSKSSMGVVLNNFRQCILDDSSWFATVSDPGNPDTIRCLFTQAGCNDGDSAVIHILTNPSPVWPDAFCMAGYDSLRGDNGFTMDGRPCTSYDDSGHDECPYHIDFTWTANCPPGGASPCQFPSETVVARIKYRHQDAHVVLNLGDGFDRSTRPDETFAITRAGSNNYPALGLYPMSLSMTGDQRRSMIRSQTAGPTSNLPVVIRESRALGTPAGACANGGTVQRVMTDIQSDPGMLVKLNADGTFKLGSGTYECTISAPGYLVGSFYVSLVDQTSGAVLIRGNNQFSSSTTGYAQTRSIGFGRFILANEDTLAIQQYCSETPGPPAVPAGDPTIQMALGVPTGWAVEEYAILHCRTFNNVL